MRVRVMVASAAEAEDIKTDKMELNCRPLFFGKGVESVVYVVRTEKDDGTQLCSSLIRVCGRTGKIVAIDRTKPVIPVVERPVSDKKSVKPAVPVKGT